MKKFLFLLIASMFLVFPSVAQSAEDLTVNVEPEQGSELVLGRQVKSTYQYTMDLRSAQVAFTVDETYSMGGPMEGVKDNIQWFFREIGGSSEGTVIGSGCKNDGQNSWCPNSREPRDLGSEEGLMSDTTKLENAAGRLTERTFFEGPDSTVSEALSYGGEATDYSGNNYYDDESYDYNTESSKAIIWVQSGRTGSGSCSGISDFSRGGLGWYMQENGFEFYAIVRDLSGCRSNYETAASNTGGKVYDLSNNPSNEDWQDILGEISSSLDTSVKLNSLVTQSSYSEDDYDENFDQSGYKNYRFLNAPDTKGFQSASLIWRPTDYGNLDIKSGESFVEVEQSDGSFKNYYFDTSQNSDIKYVDFNVVDFEASRDSSGLNLKAWVRNDGNVESLEREIAIEDGSGNSYSETLPALNSGEVRVVELNVPAGHPVLDTVGDLQVHADPSGFWDGKAGETAIGAAHGEALEPDEENNKLDFSYPPQIQGISFEDYSNAHAFNVVGDIKMENAGSNGECRLNFTDSEGNRFPSSGTVEGELTGSGNGGTCLYDNVNSSISGFDVEEEIDVFMGVENEEGTYMNLTASKRIPNRPPVIQVQNPDDGDSVVEDNVELRTFIEDPEGDVIEHVEFIEEDGTATGSKIGEISQPGQGSNNIEWDSLDRGTYEWSVTAKDPYESRETAPYTFSKVISRNYRIQNMVEYDYDSLIVSQDGSGTMSFESSLEDGNRKVTTYLDGENISAEFVSNGEESKTYEVGADNTQRHQIIVNGEDTGETKLKIISEDQELNINTTETFPVYVRPSTDESSEVPGLTGLYLIFILSSASVIYFSSV